MLYKIQDTRYKNLYFTSDTFKQITLAIHLICYLISLELFKVVLTKPQYDGLVSNLILVATK